MSSPPLEEDLTGSGDPQARFSRFGRWTISEYDLLPSTNLAAAPLPPWHAIRADRQTAGRGRFQRAWVSDLGGLWMSAVLPISADSALSRILPLAAGLAVCRAVGDFGVEGVRMRWPNDVLVQDAKLAGILLDQFVAGRCVIGIGLNVSNRPEQCDRSLSGRVARLADLVHPVPSLNALLQHLLEHLEIVCHQSEAIGVQALLPAINSLWPERRNVELQLDGQVISGAFEGVDAAGRLQLRTRGDECRYYEPHQVQLLREKIYT